MSFNPSRDIRFPEHGFDDRHDFDDFEDEDSVYTAGSRGEMSTGSRGEMSTGSRGEISTGSRGERSTGSRGERSTGSRGGMSTGSRGERSTGSRAEISTGSRANMSIRSQAEISTGNGAGVNADLKVRRNVRKCFGVPLRYVIISVIGFVVALAFGFGISSTFAKKNTSSSQSSSNIGAPLSFRYVNGTYKFKIVQLADLHLCEAPQNPEQDDKTWALVDRVLTSEKPDLIVLSGDQISANFCRDNATAYYHEIGVKLTPYGIRWALIFGSTDDMDSFSTVPGNKTDVSPLPAMYSRDDLIRVDMQFPLSLTQRGPPQLFGVSNYYLEIFAEKNVAAMIYLLDSGGGSLPAELLQNQVDWFYHSDQRPPAVAFQHYPTSEFQFHNQCMGTDGENKLDALHYDPGIVNAMSESARVYFLAAAHDHGNDYCCPYTQWMQVCFGRRTGYGGYGTWDRGARVYELELKDPTLGELDWKSYVFMENGSIRDEITMDGMLQQLQQMIALRNKMN